MSRNWWRWLVGGSVGLIALAFIGGFLLLSSDWLRDQIRQTIIAATEKATGGRVEVEGFRYDWRALTAEVSRFAIHGTEPAGEAPLLETGQVRVELQIISLLAKQVRPTNVEIVNPRVHVIVQPDGSTNLPKPRTTPSKKTVPDTIVDLKIAKFSLRDGSFVVDAPGRQKKAVPLDMKGEGLRALFTFEDLRDRYAGELALGHLTWNGMGIELSTQAVVERNRILLRNASVKTKDTQVKLDEVAVENLAEPVITAKWEASASASDWVKQVKGALHGKGTARFRSNTDYEVLGAIEASGVAVDRFRNLRGTAELTLKPDVIRLARLRASALGGDFAGEAEVRDFKTLSVKGKASRFRLAQLTPLMGLKPLPYDAMISGQVEASGPFERLKASANLTLDPVNGQQPVRGIVIAKYEPADQKIDLGQSWVELPHSRVDVSGTLGYRLEVKATSTDIADILPFLSSDFPSVRYTTASFAGTVKGPLTHPGVQGSVSAVNAVANDVTLDSIAGEVTASSQNVAVRRVRVVYDTAQVRVDGNVGLTEWRIGKSSPVTASVTAGELEVQRLLTLAGRKDFPATGRLNAAVQITGTVGNPKITGDVAVSRGSLYSQPFDSITARAQVASEGVETMTGLVVSGAKRVNISGSFTQAGAKFPEGQLTFNITSNTMPLNQIEMVKLRQPTIQGFGKLHAEGEVKIRRDAKQDLQFEVISVNGDASLNGVEIEGRNLGDTRLTATTKGTALTAHFESNITGIAARGDGTMQLTGDYPVDAAIRFNDTTVNALAALVMKPEDVRNLAVDGVVEADVKVTGPAKRPDDLRAELNIGKLEFRPAAGSEVAKLSKGYALANEGPIRAVVTRSQVKIESAKLKGPQSELSLSGALAFTGDSPLSAQVKGQINLALLGMFDRDLSSGGMITIDAGIKGNLSSPVVTGRAQLKNGEAHYAGFSNGLSNANGEIVFNGSRATIQSLSGETGGGRIDATGFAALSNGVVAFRLDAKARDVRVRFQDQGFSSVSNANLTLAGTSQRSLASGDVTVQRVTINPQSDAASLLALSAQPLETASAKTGLLANMNLDIQVVTSPDLVVQTNLTESLQADANLRLRGTVTNPALLGRVNVTNGALMFFGNKYTIAQGAISFFNPTKIEPIVNFDLETRARGVDVLLTVAGQVNKLNVSYRSDPPLQFSEIVALLATGRTPTDATLAARDTGQSQSLEGIGASTLVGQAIANPVAGRLQRFFGVSRLKIDPRLTGITGSPQARLTIEQQVTPDVLFTYVTDVSNTSTQLVRVEWALNKNWSALLTREETGKVGLDFSFKKRFK